MDPQDWDTNTKLEVLKFVHTDQRGEIQYRRQREARIFTWSSSLMLALIGALLIYKQTETLVWKPYGVWGNAVASTAVVLLIVYSTLWQQRTHRIRAQNVQVIRRISELLQCFEEGTFDPDGPALFPAEWAQHGRLESSLFCRLRAANYVSATILLGILTLVMIWVP